MRPDSYRTRSPDSWDNYAEEGSQQQNNFFNFSDRSMAVAALFVSGMALATMIFAIIFIAILERRWALLDNDWTQMNAYLAQQSIIKDENGHYVKQEK